MNNNYHGNNNNDKRINNDNDNNLSSLILVSNVFLSCLNVLKLFLFIELGNCSKLRNQYMRDFSKRNLSLM